MDAFLRSTELDRTTLPEFVERVLASEEGAAPAVPRAYPGYPSWPLPRPRPRRLASVDRLLAGRRCERTLEPRPPGPRALGRILLYAHGVFREDGRGPVPSAGSLQALELYAVVLEDAWLPAGAYHYDRAAHALAQVRAGADRTRWGAIVPSFAHVSGGALLWIVAGDLVRAAPRYGERAGRFLLLEAGHLMQGLCLLAASHGLSTVPLGGVLEPEVARELGLPRDDAVLYAAVSGRPIAGPG